MIAIVRNADNRVMNVREGSDWRKAIFDPKIKQTKGERLIELQETLENTSEKEPQKRKELQAAIDTLQSQWENWLLRRRELCAKQFGGVATDYFTVDVPKEEEKTFLTARYVEYDGESLTYDTRPIYNIEGSKITITKGWVRQNESLLEDDETDWAGEVLTEPLFFQLWYTQNTATHEITVQLLIREEDEEFTELPANLMKRGKFPICQGRVNLDHSITVGGF